MGSVQRAETIVRVEARSTARQAACPGCGCRSGRVHGSYLRFPRDLPTAGHCVVVVLRVRRFVCTEASCPRKTSVEQVPELTRRFGRRTERLRSTLISVGLAPAGRAGARMADAFGAPVSRNTLLRLITSLPEPPTVTPRVVGVPRTTARPAARRGRPADGRPRFESDQRALDDGEFTVVVDPGGTLLQLGVEPVPRTYFGLAVAGCVVHRHHQPLRPGLRPGQTELLAVPGRPATLGLVDARPEMSDRLVKSLPDHGSWRNWIFVHRPFGQVPVQLARREPSGCDRPAHRGKESCWRTPVTMP
ncbi:hypothetical protein J2Z21_008909 [Streptomyces griseochromogenes]|uniref:Transposase IS204/IS1001/IS1096/IS1165 zinc-finger domain-containing protein n=1 Tax=Streptomyces griseochromogenes TaxID=68214 RepID=A0ABS4M8A6_9ACTN|nr:hypothetical protein [Streptomyces griseochromogenes]